MEALLSFQGNILRSVKQDFIRFLSNQINWNQRMIAIKGLRGAGKTTLLLQHIKFGLQKNEKALYATADHPWFYTHSLLELAELWSQTGGNRLFIDEVHKYPNWSNELKNIYDGFPEMHIVFTSSSALNIFKGQADLSRRVKVYELPGLSFREYLELKHNITKKPLELKNILNNHTELAQQFLKEYKPLPLFKEYLQTGYLPFSIEGNDQDYLLKLAQTINAVLENDLAGIEGYTASALQKIKRLLGVIAEVAPFEPNISSLARKMNLGRDSVYNYLDHLEKARLLNFLRYDTHGVAALQKPDKIYLENSNMAYALTPETNAGTMRETFIINQLKNARHAVHLASKGDFVIDNKWTVEVGGRNKTGSQITGIEKSFIVSDQIEIGFGNRVPLWLWGFLY